MCNIAMNFMGFKPNVENSVETVGILLTTVGLLSKTVLKKWKTFAFFRDSDMWKENC